MAPARSVRKTGYEVQTAAPRALRRL